MRLSWHIPFTSGLLALAISAIWGLRPSPYMPDMAFAPRFLFLSLASVPVWIGAAVGTAAVMGLLGRNSTRWVLCAAAGAGLASVITSYFYLGTISALFAPTYPTLYAMLVPGTQQLLVPLTDYLVGESCLSFLALWLAANAVWRKIAPGAPVLGAPPVTVPGPAFAPAPPETAAAVHRPPFMARVPAQLGDDLISVAASEHYIKVQTTRGQALVLYRFCDALRELEGLPGLRVHRSYWVMRSAVREITPCGKSYRLTLQNGDDVPVSVAYRGVVEQVCGRPFAPVAREPRAA